MKALEILNRFKNSCESAFGFNNRPVASLGEMVDAILELESLKQQNIALQARIEELEKPNTCKGCKYIKFSAPLNEFVCEEGIANDISKLGCGCITMPSIFNCSLYEPKDT